MNIVILGPQGSGKGTQAELLAKRYNLEHIDMGKALRQVALLDTPLGKEIHEIINVRKELVSDRILKEVLHIKLADLPREQGIIFDGVPRNTEQAQYFDEALLEFGRRITRVFILNLSEEGSIRRISRRRVCSKCKTIYILGKDIDKENEACSKCGGEIITRPDDSEEGVRKRLGIYKEETLPIINFYKEKGVAQEIDGDRSIEVVFEDIVEQLEKIA